MDVYVKKNKKEEVGQYVGNLSPSEIMNIAYIIGLNGITFDELGESVENFSHSLHVYDGMVWMDFVGEENEG